MSGEAAEGEGVNSTGAAAEGRDADAEAGAGAGAGAGAAETPGKEGPSSTSGVNQAPSELPPEIKAKLRRLDKMETRYHGMTG